MSATSSEILSLDERLSRSRLDSIDLSTLRLLHLATPWCKDDFAERLAEGVPLKAKKESSLSAVMGACYTILCHFSGKKKHDDVIISSIFAVLANHSLADATIQGSVASTQDVPKDSSLAYENCELGSLFAMVEAGKRSANHHDIMKAQEIVDYCAFWSLIVIRYYWRRNDADSPYKLKAAIQAFSELFGYSGRPMRFMKPSPIMCFSSGLTAVIIDSYETTTSEKLKAFYRAGCLTDLEENGLGLITWINKACNALGHGSMTLILDVCADESLFWSSAKRFKTFWESEPKPRAWQYCRLLDQNAMSNFSVKENVNMCMLCVYITFGLDNGERKLAEIPQFKDHINSSNKEKCRSLAKLILKYAQVKGLRLPDCK